MAAAQAVLNVIREERLQEHSQQVGARLLGEFSRLAERHECVGDVRGGGVVYRFRTGYGPGE
ncbi:hypothetical protein [Burkholderia cenocepacia]|uniref:hypothetical protein n=1 Tax=Burkholderia cenocepacia TaxID=95486 RepID=UPI003BF5FBC7